MKLNPLWIAAIPDDAAPNLNEALRQEERQALVALLREDDLRQLVAGHPRHLAFRIRRALRRRNEEEVYLIAKAVVNFLKTLIDLLDTPPSEEELEKFIEERQLGLQETGDLLRIHDGLTAEGNVIYMFIDPRTRQLANPVMWVAAIERVERISARHND